MSPSNSNSKASSKPSRPALVEVSSNTLQSTPAKHELNKQNLISGNDYPDDANLIPSNSPLSKPLDHVGHLPENSISKHDRNLSPNTSVSANLLACSIQSRRHSNALLSSFDYDHSFALAGSAQKSSLGSVSADMLYSEDCGGPSDFTQNLEYWLCNDSSALYESYLDDAHANPDLTSAAFSETHLATPPCFSILAKRLASAPPLTGQMPLTRQLSHSIMNGLHESTSHSANESSDSVIDNSVYDDDGDDDTDRQMDPDNNIDHIDQNCNPECVVTSPNNSIAACNDADDSTGQQLTTRSLDSMAGQSSPILQPPDHATNVSYSSVASYPYTNPELIPRPPARLETYSAVTSSPPAAESRAANHCSMSYAAMDNLQTSCEKHDNTSSMSSHSVVHLDQNLESSGTILITSKPHEKFSTTLLDRENPCATDTVKVAETLQDSCKDAEGDHDQLPVLKSSNDINDNLYDKVVEQEIKIRQLERLIKTTFLHNTSVKDPLPTLTNDQSVTCCGEATVHCSPKQQCHLCRHNHHLCCSEEITSDTKFSCTHAKYRQRITRQPILECQSGFHDQFPHEKFSAPCFGHTIPSPHIDPCPKTAPTIGAVKWPTPLTTNPFLSTPHSKVLNMSSCTSENFRSTLATSSTNPAGNATTSTAAAVATSTLQTSAFLESQSTSVTEACQACLLHKSHVVKSELSAVETLVKVAEDFKTIIQTFSQIHDQKPLQEEQSSPHVEPYKDLSKEINYHLEALRQDIATQMHAIRLAILNQLDQLRSEFTKNTVSEDVCNPLRVTREEQQTSTPTDIESIEPSAREDIQDNEPGHIQDELEPNSASLPEVVVNDTPIETDTALDTVPDISTPIHQPDEQASEASSREVTGNPGVDIDKKVEEYRKLNSSLTKRVAELTIENARLSQLLKEDRTTLEALKTTAEQMDHKVAELIRTRDAEWMKKLRILMRDRELRGKALLCEWARKDGIVVQETRK